MCFISSGSFSGQKRCQVLRTDKNITNKNGWGNHSSNLSCPFKGRQMCWRPNTFFSPFYQQLAVVAGRCLDWFSVNPDTLSHYTHADTHTHRVVSRLQAQAALWAETLQNASQNNNLLSDTNTAIICKPPWKTCIIPHTEARHGQIGVWFCLQVNITFYICCVRY